MTERDGSAWEEIRRGLAEQVGRTGLVLVHPTRRGQRILMYCLVCEAAADLDGDHDGDHDDRNGWRPAEVKAKRPDHAMERWRAHVESAWHRSNSARVGRSSIDNASSS